MGGGGGGDGGGFDRLGEKGVEDQRMVAEMRDRSSVAYTAGPGASRLMTRGGCRFEGVVDTGAGEAMGEGRFFSSTTYLKFVREGRAQRCGLERAHCYDRAVLMDLVISDDLLPSRVSQPLGRL